MRCLPFLALLFILLLAAAMSAGSPVSVTANAGAFCDSVTQIPQIECEALVALYNSTDGPNWDNQWLINTTPCGSWHGLSCAGGSNVTGIGMLGNNLNGSLPPELGNLSHLETLILGVTNLTGSIPAALGNLSSLQTLWLLESNLSGPIPPELGNLTNLTVLSLRSNQLNGAIPTELSNLANLEVLSLRENQLTGALPPELSTLANLNELYVSSNLLSGPIPQSYTALALQRIQYEETELCAPLNATFQSWLASVSQVGSNGLICLATNTAYLPLVHSGGDPSLFFFDDFANSNSGWLVQNFGNINFSYQNGEYELLLLDADFFAWASAPILQNIANYSVEADIRQASGDRSNFGLIFERVDSQRYYLFLIRPIDQTYSLWQVGPGGSALIDWTVSSHIFGGGVTNHLKVIRNGRQISLYVNGERLLGITNAAYTGTLREVGVYAESVGEGNVAVRFDNFRVNLLNP